MTDHPTATDWQDAYFTALEKLKTETLEPADMSVLWGRVKAVTMAFDALRAHADALAETNLRLQDELTRLRAERDRLEDRLEDALEPVVSDVELEDALTGERIYVYGPDAERFERMFAAVMKTRAALAEGEG